MAGAKKKKKKPVQMTAGKAAAAKKKAAAAKKKAAAAKKKAAALAKWFRDEFGKQPAGRIKELYERMRADGFSQEGLSEQKQKMLLFLYAKEVHAGKSSNERKAAFTDLLAPAPQYVAAKERLERLLGPKGDAVRRGGGRAKAALKGFLKACPEWKDKKKAYMAISEKTLVGRVQKSGLCYIHAPVVLQHYAVAKANPGRKIGMVDISKMMRRADPGDFDFARHIFDSKGGDSAAMLKKLCGNKDPGLLLNVDPQLFQDGSKNPAALLQEHGPALLSGFRVHEDFHADHKVKFEGKPRGDDVGGHAMVLVGAREEAGKRRYLVQNWWPNQQFVEFDEEYLVGCEPTARFVTKPLKKIPAKFPQRGETDLETELIDKEEQLDALEW